MLYGRRYLTYCDEIDFHLSHLPVHILKKVKDLLLNPSLQAQKDAESVERYTMDTIEERNLLIDHLS